MNWISIKERLPENSNNVLCWLGDVILMGTYHPEKDDISERWEFFFSDNGRLFDKYWQKFLTHWMPLPEPPKP